MIPFVAFLLNPFGLTREWLSRTSGRTLASTSLRRKNYPKDRAS